MIPAATSSPSTPSDDVDEDYDNGSNDIKISSLDKRGPRMAKTTSARNEQEAPTAVGGLPDARVWAASVGETKRATGLASVEPGAVQVRLQRAARSGCPCLARRSRASCSPHADGALACDVDRFMRASRVASSACRHWMPQWEAEVFLRGTHDDGGLCRNARASGCRRTTVRRQGHWI